MLRRLRIPVQLACLGLFLYLLIRTLGTGEDQLGPPVRVFLEIDPLVGLTTWLRTGALPGLMALSLITLVATFFLGRFFCAWVCPLGTLSQISGRLLRRRQEERRPDRWRPAQRWKFYLLLFVLGGALTGSLWTGLLDPISLLLRGLAQGFGPSVEASIRSAAKVIASGPLSPLSEPAYRWLRDHALAPLPPRYEQATLLAGLLLLVVGLSWIVRRFWCRILCPLGGLLGAVAQGGTLRLQQREESCTDCGLCTFHCQGAADPDQMDGWRPSECFVCGNCTSSCRQGGLAFGFTAPRAWGALKLWLSAMERRLHRAPSHDRRTPGMERRRFLLAAGLGILSGPLGKVSTSLAHPAGGLIRPPGAATESEFLDRCVRCGECMKVCPANGLHPADLQAGLLGLWTPVLRPRLGYCEYHCTLCGQVCPTGAIPRLSAEQKERAVLGLAYVDPGRCLPLAYATPCIVCEEHCPTSPKAIELEEATVVAPDGVSRRVRRPRVIPRLCVGCGICEFRCPVEGAGAIMIAATGRTGTGGPFDLGKT